MSAIALATTALGINELLELILSHLPPRDLLLLQRTATVWRDTIRRSVIIQTKLYYSRGDPISTMAWIQPRFVDHLWLQPRVTVARSLRFAPVLDVRAHEVFSVNASYNDLLGTQNTTRHLTRRIVDGEILCVHESVRKVIFRDETPLSCDDMFVTQPPARRLLLILCCKCGCQFSLGPYSYLQELPVVRPEGVRVRDVREVVREQYPRACRFVIHIKALRELWRDPLEQYGLLFPLQVDWAYLEQARLNLELLRSGKFLDDTSDSDL